MTHWQTLWTFKTARFTIRWQVTPCEDLDLSWCETGETRENINSGLWEAFDSRMQVLLDGREVGCDYLSQSIYEKPREFRDHIGMNAKGHGSYFSSMVREAVSEARKTIAREAATMPRLRAA